MTTVQLHEDDRMLKLLEYDSLYKSDLQIQNLENHSVGV